MKFRKHWQTVGLFIILLCVYTFLYSPVVDYVFTAPVYIKSVVRDLMYDEQKFSCHYELGGMVPEIFDTYTSNINAARTTVLKRSYHDSLAGVIPGKVILLEAETTEDYQHKIDSLGHIITVSHRCVAPNCGLPEVTKYKWGMSLGLCPEKSDKLCEEIPPYPVERSFEKDEIHPAQEAANSKPDFYIHLIPNGTIDKIYGFVRTGNIIVMPRTCLIKEPASSVAQIREKEVFVISQYWGGGWYHGSIEDIPRLAAYVAFLRDNPTIKIHIHHRSARRIAGYVTMLGIDPGRLIKGAIQADVVYLPQGGGCGQLHEPSGHILTSLYQTCMANLQIESRPKVTPEPAIHFTRNLVILIKRSVRSQGRGLTQHDLIESETKALASAYNLEFYTFSDTSIPSFSEMMVLFQRAVLIIGPHGAGLSNMIFSQPGTYIIEVLCRSAINLCYIDIASKQGMHYRGIVSKESDCTKMDLDLGELMYTLTFFLEDHKKRTT